MNFLRPDALLDLLSERIVDGQKPIVFVVGAGLSLPRGDKPGVPGASDMVQLVKERLQPHVPIQDPVDYQQAFELLIDRFDLAEANKLVQQAVLGARLDGQRPVGPLTTDDLKKLEADHGGWHVPKAHTAIALLVAHFPKAFGDIVLTTNFDPLLEVSFTKARMSWFATSLQKDGSVEFTRGTGLHIVHLHGHWWHSDTLHTKIQLSGPRPDLAAALGNILSKSTLVVVGYGGWDDILMSTLRSSSRKDVVWCFRQPSEQVTQRAAYLCGTIGSDATFAADIDAEEFLPALFDAVIARKPADDLATFFDRLRVHYDYREVYQSLGARAWVFGRDYGEELSEQCKALDRFLPGQSARAAIHAARFLLSYVDPQGIHQQYDWTVGTPLRLLLLDALALLDGDSTKRNDVATGENRAFVFMTDRDRHGALRALVSETIQDAVCAVLAWHEGRRLLPASSAMLRELEEVGTYTSTRFDNYGGVGPVSGNWRTWSGKAIHKAYRVLRNDARSLLGYMKACIAGELDHQAALDRSAEDLRTEKHAEGLTSSQMYKELGQDPY